jgi:CheY-like chemotaxis protein
MKVRQVLLNLLSNAAKFTEQGSITTVASLQTSPDGQQEVLVSVTDSGPGIAPEDQIKLFQPFSQVDGSLTRRAGGSGLGLSICHHLVHMHGGRIGLKSQVGKGSTFYFTLPVQGPKSGRALEEIAQPELSSLEEGLIPEEPAPAEVLQKVAVAAEAHEEPPAIEQPIETLSLDYSPPTTATTARAAVEGAPGEARDAATGMTTKPPDAVRAMEVKPGLLLSIDKDPKVIDLYRRYLMNEGITIIALTDLDQVMNVARGLLPSAITLDVAMQPPPDLETDLDGWEVLQALKNDSITQHIPVIVCTILNEQEKALSLGADDYLMKPILQDDLLLSIRRILG